MTGNQPNPFITDPLGAWLVVIVWTAIAGQWIYRQGRRRGWWDKAGHELDLKYPEPPPKPDRWREPLGNRVLQDRFRTWPRIYQGGTKARPVVTLKARYASPQSVKSARLWAAIAAVALFVWMERRATAWVPGDDSAWFQANIGPLFWCAVFAFIAFLIFRALFPHVLWRVPGFESPLVMRFEGGRITWGLGPRWLKAWQFWRADPRGYVAPLEPRHAEKLPFHRKAQAMADLNADRQARRLKPKPDFYRTASEVVMFVGPDLESWRPVAELAADPTAQWASRLASAINAADQLALSLLPRQEAEPRARPEPGPIPSRRPDPEPGGLLE